MSDGLRLYFPSHPAEEIKGDGSGPLKGLSEMPPTEHYICYDSWQRVGFVFLKVQ